nr:cob(I)yrinic acid a,c-diamide adenosyltransferase [Lachnospiraceae bacterium]
MNGLIHIYCGENKGKTTASVGLSVRAAGAGKKVLFTQYLKRGDSAELGAMRLIPGIRILVCDKPYGFIWTMDDEEKARAHADFTGLFEEAVRIAAEEEYDLLVLDEILGAIACGMVPEDAVIRFLQEKPAGLEVVLTGRDPSPALVDLADYVTEMKKIKHPFDKGVPARKGIEY